MYKPALLNLLAASAASAQLHSLALDAGLDYFGTAMDNGYTSDSDFMAIVNDVDEFGQLVPENGQKWDSTEPSEGSFTYTNADVVPDLAKSNGQILRCHTLTWYSQLPSWVSSGSWTKAELTSVIEAHISNVVGHFKGDCYAWDVVNEAASDDGGWRSSIFYETMGTDFLAVSFNAAAEADPDAKLYYNDYNLEYNGAKTDKAVEIVQIIQGAGAPIDGVGFQGHLIVGSTPSRSTLATALKRFTALGLEVAYTELDIRHSSTPASDSALQTQAEDYVNVVGSCLDVEGCVGVTVWVFTDKYSWVPDTFSGAGEACLYNEDYSKKPAWTSVSSLLAAAATGSSVASSSAAEAVVSTTAATTAAAETTAATETTVAVESTAAVETSVAVESTAAAETTVAAETPSSESAVVVSSVEKASTPVYTPVLSLSTPTTFLTRVNTGFPGGFNSSVPRTTPQATLEATTTSVDSIPSSAEPESSIQFPSLNLPSNQTVVTTIVAAPASTRVPVIRHSSTAYSSVPWTNGTVTTIVSSVYAGTAPVATLTETETDDEGDDDCEELVAHYYQCGGRNWDGPTQCEEPYVCVEMNEWYSQCADQ